MTQYVQLRDSDANKNIMDKGYFTQHPTATTVIEELAKTFMREWFPRSQPVGEDLENWKEIARLDALLAIRTLVAMGLLSDIDSAKVFPVTNDERMFD